MLSQNIKSLKNLAMLSIYQNILDWKDTAFPPRAHEMSQKLTKLSGSLKEAYDLNNFPSSTPSSNQLPVTGSSVSIPEEEKLSVPSTLPVNSESQPLSSSTTPSCETNGKIESVCSFPRQELDASKEINVKSKDAMS